MENPELITIRERFQRDFAMNASDAALTSANRWLAAYTEDCLRQAAALGLGSKPVINLISGEFLARLNGAGIAPEQIMDKAIKPGALAKIAWLVFSGKVSASAAKTLFEKAWKTGGEPEALLKELGLAQVSDAALLETWAREAIGAHPEAAEDFRKGSAKALGPIVGTMLKRSKGQANPQLAGEVLKKLLS
jgi:aspartyl-tRNA(Asn)/glutamyl-tRNA(Gln) amidotransferase subunit B